MSLRLVERSASYLAGRTSRRGFLARSAVVGSAVAVGPLRYLLRPGTAYAAVCGCGNTACDCGALCCDGFTDFCCVVNRGRNSCPPGTTPGGWWKADGTSFCSGPRFYMDCNYACGVSDCRCGNDDCNHRKVGCNVFRYGQCHQEIGCMGAIACRVVTCTPPWVIDPSCTQVSATDQSTADHTTECPPPAVDWAALAALARALEQQEDDGMHFDIVRDGNRRLLFKLTPQRELVYKWYAPDGRTNWPAAVLATGTALPGEGRVKAFFANGEGEVYFSKADGSVGEVFYTGGAWRGSPETAAPVIVL